MERLPPARWNLRAFAKTLAAAGRRGWLRRETLDVGRRGRDEIGPDGAGGEREGESQPDRSRKMAAQASHGRAPPQDRAVRRCARENSRRRVR